MKIGIDAHGLGGRSLGAGNEQYSRQLILNLLEIDGENEYHLFVNEPEELRGLAERHRNVRLVRLRPASQWVQRPFSAPLYAWRAGLDVLHFPFIRPPVASARTVVTVHDTLYETVPQFYTSVERARMKMLVPGSCRRADLIFTVSEFSRQQIQSHYGIPAERIVVTPNAADHVDEGPALEESDFEGLPEQFICFIGTLQPRKNLARLVRAFDDLLARRELPHHLLLVGRPGWDQAELRGALESARRRDRIHMTGFTTGRRMKAILQRSKLLVCPSLAEGFSVPPLEAQRAGIPVVVSNTTCFPEIYRDSAEACDPLSVASIANAMERALCNDGVRERLVEEGRRNALRFSWRRTAEIALDAYRTLARRAEFAEGRVAIQ